MDSLNWLGKQPEDTNYEKVAKPYNMRAIILDYLLHQGFASTARVFAKDSKMEDERRLDADGDDIMTPKEDASGLEDLLRVAELRQRVRNHLLCGRVEEARTLLDEHFPSVLAPGAPAQSEPRDSPTTCTASNYVPTTSVDPAVLSLNLRIHTFIEESRSIPLVYGSHTAESSDTMSIVDDVARPAKQLERMRKMNAIASTMDNPKDRVRFGEEINRVVSLIAYNVPESSPMSYYLHQERREALADQIHAAILYRLGLPTISHMELYSRYTSTMFSYFRELKIQPSNAPKNPTPIPPSDSQLQPDSPDLAPAFRLSGLLDSMP